MIRFWVFFKFFEFENFARTLLSILKKSMVRQTHETRKKSQKMRNIIFLAANNQIKLDNYT